MGAEADRPQPIRAILGLAIALGLPALAVLGSLGGNLPAEVISAVALSFTPWLVLLWMLGVERLPLAGIGLGWQGWASLGWGIAGAAVSLGISLGVGALDARIGWHESQSALMTQLLSGPGWLLVLVVTNGALLTEVAFRGYALERLGLLFQGRMRLALALQILVTTLIFGLSRGLGHGTVWLVDDIVFGLFYLRRRDLCACLIAHALPNLVASTLIATGVAG